jgi:hypothetical protein
MLDLDAIEARAEAATPGDHWFADLEPEDQLSYEVWAAQDPDEESSNGVVTELGCKKADAYFIASARADIPAMVAELRAAREVVEAAAGFSDAFMAWLEVLGFSVDSLVATDAGDNLNACRVHFWRDVAAYRAVVGEA